MRAQEVTDTLDLALQASGCDQVRAAPKPGLLSDNGSSYVLDDLAEWLQDKGRIHSRGACLTARTPQNRTHQLSLTPSEFRPPLVPRTLTTDTLQNVCFVPCL